MALGVEVGLLPGDDDAVEVAQLLADVLEAGGVLDGGQDGAAGLLGGAQRDAAPAVSLVAALVLAQADDGALGQEGDDALDAQLGGLADGLAHAVALGDALDQREMGELLDGELALDAAGDALLVDIGDLDLPRLASFREAGDVLAHLAAAHVDVAQLRFVEGQRDLAVVGQRGVDEEAGKRHGFSYQLGINGIIVPFAPECYSGNTFEGRPPSVFVLLLPIPMQRNCGCDSRRVPLPGSGMFHFPLFKEHP